MKTEVILYNLNGQKRSIRNYAYTIADMSAGSTNAYVMAFDADNEPLWVVQAGDGIETAEETINWRDVKRVEIYDHSIVNKWEYVYITTNDSLAQYLEERDAADFVLVDNYTGKAIRFAHVVSNDDEGNDDTTDQNTTTPKADRKAAVKTAAAKVAKVAGTVARRSSFVACMAVVLIGSISIFVGITYLLGLAREAFSLSGWVCTLSFIGLMFTVMLDLTAWVEINAMVLVKRIFPEQFAYGDLNTFVRPFSVIGRTFSACRA